MFDEALPELYAQHIHRLEEAYATALAEHGIDALLVHAGRPLAKSRFDDQYWPFLPAAFFGHWLPNGEPGSCLLIRSGQRPALYRAPHDSYWESPPPPAPDWVLTHFEVSDGGGEALPQLSTGCAFIGDCEDEAGSLGIDPKLTNAPALLRTLDGIRAHKSEYERRCIARANAIAARGHRRLAERFAAGPCSELELHLAYLEATGQDAGETPYGNIVAIGRHAAILHHNAYDRETLSEGSLLVDAGATCLGYASDITRTLTRGQDETTRTFRALVDALDGVQQDLCRQLVPGISYEALHDRAHLALADIVADVGLISGSRDELVESGATRLLFPHGLGHSLGLQVHDVGCKPRAPSERNPYLRTTAEVAPGHVFTIEPGCYFIPALLDQLRASSVSDRVNWPLVDELGRLGGIRIEDNVAVIEGGSVNLTRDNWSAWP